MWESLRNNRLEKCVERKLKQKRSKNLDSITKVGVLLDVTAFADIKRAKNCFQKIVPSASVCLLINDPDKVPLENEQELFYAKNDLNWKGVVTAESDTAKFLAQEYDLLINYFVDTSVDFKLVSAMTKTKISLGFNCKENLINAIKIAAEPREIDTFVEILKNYLPQIK